MTDSERISTLIYLLEDGVAVRFAKKCGIRPDVLSRVINHGTRQRTIFPRILAAYPNVRKEWLVSGRGEPLTDMPPVPPATTTEELARAINRLAEAIEKLLPKLK